MPISIDLTHLTAEACDSAKQTVEGFREALAEADLAPVEFSQIEFVAFCLRIAHPLAQNGVKRSSGSYHKATATFYAAANLDYAAWVKPDWATRVIAVGSALTAAARAIHKTRITELERSALLALIEQLERRTLANPPGVLVDLKPVDLVSVAGQSRPDVAFGNGLLAGCGAERTMTLQPEQVEEYLSAQALEPAQRRPEMFKRYRRSEGILEYREAWPAEGVVIEHWGLCGERGTTSQHPAPTAADQVKVLKRLKSKAVAMGFKSISISRHAKIVVQAPVDGMGTLQDLDERHELESFLDEWMGWRGLGFCDGGEIGSGGMDAVCFVVDAAVARAALADDLARSKFSGFNILPPERPKRRDSEL